MTSPRDVWLDGVDLTFVDQIPCYCIRVCRVCGKFNLGCGME